MKKLSLVLISIFSVLLCTFLTACGKNVEVKFEKSEYILAIDDTLNLNDIISIKNGDKKDVDFKFSNPLLFDVENKVAKAKASGDGYIHAYFKSQNLASVHVVVQEEFSAPTGFNIDKNEVLDSQGDALSWQAVSGAMAGQVQVAKEYLIEGTCDGDPISKGKAQNGQIKVDKNELNFITDLGGEQGKYELKIKALSVGYFSDSEFANVTVYYKYAMPAENLVWENGLLSWEKEEDYTYRVEVDGESMGDFADISQMDLTQKFNSLDAGEHSVKVVSHSLSPNLIDRDSQSLVIKKLETPTITFQNGELQISQVEDAEKYVLIFDDESSFEYDSTHKNLQGLNDGRYVAKAVAKHENGLYFDSTPSEQKTFYKLGKLNTVFKGGEVNSESIKVEISSSSPLVDTNFVVSGLEDVVLTGFTSGVQNKVVEIPVSAPGKYQISFYQTSESEDINGAYIINGDVTETFEINKVGAIGTVSHSYDFSSWNSKISFSSVEGTERYELQTSSGRVLDSKQAGQEETVEFVLSSYLEDLIEDEKLVVCAFGKENFSIGSSVIENYEILEATNFKVRENKSFSVEWDEISDANGYLIEYYKFASKDEYTSFEMDESDLSLSSQIVYTNSYTFDGEGYYYFSVKVVPQNSNEFLASKKTETKLIVAKETNFDNVKFGYDENQITDLRSGYYIEIISQEDDHINGYTFSETNLSIEKIPEGNRYYIGKIEAGQHTISITANTDNEEIYLPATTEINLTKLSAVVYSELKVDETGNVLTVDDKMGVTQVVIKNEKLTEQSTTGSYNLPKQNEIILKIQRLGSNKESFDIAQPIYLDSEEATLTLKRVMKGENLKYDGTKKQLTLSCQEIEKAKYWVLDIVGKDDILSVRFDSSVVTKLNGQTFDVGAQSEYISLSGKDVKIELGKVLDFIKTKKELLDFYTQNEDITFSVYAYQHQTIDCLEISSLYATTSSDPSSTKLEIPRLPAPTLSLNKQNMTLSWTNVSEDASINSKTEYKLFYQKGSEEETQLDVSSSSYNLETERFEFVEGQSFKFYVKAVNPEFLDESVSNEIFIQRLKRLSTISLVENTLKFSPLDDSDFWEKIELKINGGEAQDVTRGSVEIGTQAEPKYSASYSFKIIGKQLENYYYLDSDESIWTISKMANLISDDTSFKVDFNGNVISWTKFPSELDCLEYVVRFTDSAGFVVELTTTDLSIDLAKDFSEDKEILEKLSNLKAGTIKVGVYAHFKDYQVAVGGTVYYSENIATVGYNYKAYTTNEDGQEIQKFAQPEVTDVKFIYQDQPELEGYLKNAQSPQIQVTFKGHYGENGKFKIVVGETILSDLEVTHDGADGDLHTYHFVLNSKDYANESDAGNIKILIYALTIEDNASSIPSSAKVLEIVRAETFTDINFENTTEGYLKDSLLLSYPSEALQPLGGIILKIEYTSGAESQSKYMLASQNGIVNVDGTLKVSLSEFINQNIKDGGTITKISAFVNNSSENKVYILAGKSFDSAKEYQVLKSVKSSDIEKVSGGFKIGENFNSENTIYKVTVTTEGVSGTYYISKENNFTFTFPDEWDDRQIDDPYKMTIQAFEEGKINSVVSEEISFTLERATMVDKASVTLTRGDDNQLSFSWTGVDDASGYIINVYTYIAEEKELKFSFYTTGKYVIGGDETTISILNKTNYRVEEIFGSQYQRLIDAGMSFVDNQDIKIGIVSIGKDKQNSKELLFNAQIKGSKIIEDSIKVDEFGILNFDADRGETYIYRLIKINGEGYGEWLSTKATEDLIKVDSTNVTDTETPFNITIITKGGVDTSVTAEDSNFAFDSASYTTTNAHFMKSARVSLERDNNSPQNLNLTIGKDNAKIFVGAEETDLFKGLAKEVNVQKTLSGIAYCNLPEISGLLQDRTISNGIYFWALYTSQPEILYVSSDSTLFEFSVKEETLSYQIMKGQYKEGEDTILATDYINTFATFENSDGSQINTLGIYVKVTQLTNFEEGEERFELFRFWDADKLKSINYFNDTALSEKIFGNKFVINLTSIFDENELVGRSGEFEISFLKIYTENGKYTMTTWTKVDKNFHRLAEVKNLALNQGNVIWNGNGESSYAVYFYVVDAAHENYDPQIGFDYSTLTLEKCFFTERESFNPYDFTPENIKYFLAVRSYSEQEMDTLGQYILSSSRLFKTENNVPSYHFKNIIKTPLKLDSNGKLSFSWDLNSDFIQFLQNASGDGDAQKLATSTFSIPFSFTLQDLASDIFVFRFHPKDGAVGFNYEVQVKAIDLLEDLFTAVPDARAKLETLNSVSLDAKYKQIIANFIDELTLSSNGVGYDKKLFDDYFEKVQTGQYQLEYILLGNDRRFTSAQNIFKNKDGEDVLYVNPEPDVKVVTTTSLSDKIINSYKVIIKKSVIYNKIGDNITTLIPNVYRMVFGVRSFTLSCSTMTVQLDNPELEGKTVKMYNCDKDGEISSSSTEYLMFYLNYNDGDSILGVYGEELAKTDYNMEIYAVGNEYSASSKSEKFRITLLNLSTLSLIDGVFNWSATNGRKVTIFAQHTSSREEEEFSEYTTFSLEGKTEGYWTLKFFVKGEVTNNNIYVDSEIYSITVYKLQAPTIDTYYGNLRFTNSDDNIEKIADMATTADTLYKFKVFNDQLSATRAFMIVPDKSSFEYEAGSAGLDSQTHSYYNDKLTEIDATQFYGISLGSSLELSSEATQPSNPKLYYEKTLKPTDEAFEGKTIVISSNSGSVKAKMLDDVQSLKIENGIVTWDEVVGKGESVADNIIYKVTVATYTTSTAGNTVSKTEQAKVQYYTAQNSFDFAYVNRDSHILIDDDTLLKVTVQALSGQLVEFERESEVPSTYRPYILVEGGKYIKETKENPNKFVGEDYCVLMSDRVEIDEIDRIDAVLEKDISVTDDGKLTWIYSVDNIESVDDFKTMYAFEVYDDEYNFVEGDYEIVQDGDDFTITFTDKNMKAGTYTAHIFATQGNMNEDKKIKSYPSDIQITKLAKISETDYSVVIEDNGDENLSFEEYFVLNPDNIVEVKWSEDNSVILSKESAKIKLVSDESEILDDETAIVLKADLDITFKVSRANAKEQNILFSDESVIKFVRSEWGEEDSISWEESSQRFEWTYAGDGQDSESLTFYVEITYAQGDSRTYTTQNKYFYPTVIDEITKFSVRAKINNSSVLSEAKEYDGQETNAKFDLFASGDGTEDNPYVIETETQFKNLKYRMTKDPSLNRFTRLMNASHVAETEQEIFYFKLVRDLSFLDVTGFVIDGDFGGSIDGQDGETVHKINFTSKLVANLSQRVTAEKTGTNLDINLPTFTQGSAIFENLMTSAVIKNLEITVNFKKEESVSMNVGENALLAGLAIKNSGYLSNISVTSYSSNFIGYNTRYAISLAHAGIVSSNSGTIQDCKLLSSIEIIDSNMPQNIFLGGIAYLNYGTIERCTVGEERDDRFGLRVSVAANTSGVLIGGICVVSVKTLQYNTNESIIRANATADMQVAYLAGICVRAINNYSGNSNNLKTYQDEKEFSNPYAEGFSVSETAELYYVNK